MFKNEIRTKTQEELAVFWTFIWIDCAAVSFKKRPTHYQILYFWTCLADFLIWVEQPIIDVFEHAKPTLQWQQNKLMLTILSSSTAKEEDENRLFEQFDHFYAIDNALKFIGIDLH